MKDDIKQHWLLPAFPGDPDNAKYGYEGIPLVLHVATGLMQPTPLGDAYSRAGAEKRARIAISDACALFRELDRRLESERGADIE